MLPDPALTLAEQIFWAADVFYRTLAPESCQRRVGLYWIAIFNRVKRFERRFCALYALWKAGRAPKVRDRGVAPPPLHPVAPPPPRPSPARAGEGACGAGGGSWDPGAHDAASMERARLRPASVLPRRFRWMQRMLPMSAGALASGLSSLVDNHPEMQAFVAAVPQAGRLLRPLCRMAGLTLPAWLALPKRARAARKSALSAADEDAFRRLTARFPDTPPARSAKRALRRMFERKPVDVKRLSAVAYGYYIHPPRDGNCPPPEIGYGGRTFPPLPKDYEWPKD